MARHVLCKRLVASDPRFTLRSLDDMIVEEAGMSIPEIVETRGWRWFRDAEFSACERVAAGARERRASGDTNPSDANPRWTLVDASGGVVVDLRRTTTNRIPPRPPPSLTLRPPPNV